MPYTQKNAGREQNQPLPAKALVTANRLTPLPNPTMFDKNPIESGVYSPLISSAGKSVSTWPHRFHGHITQLFGLEAHAAADLLTILEEDHGGDAPNAKLLGQIGRLIRVDLDHE